ncbi:MAG: hypothetical protein ABIL09_12745 [Gemmatimonadota bacterium]
MIQRLRSWCRPRDRQRAADLQTQLTRTLELVVDQEQLHSAIVGYMVDLCGARWGALYLWSNEAERLHEVWHTRRDGRPGAGALEGDGRLVRWLQVNEAPLMPAR